MNKKWWCFFGVHEYEHERIGTYGHMNRVWGVRYKLTCKVCGKIKRKDL